MVFCTLFDSNYLDKGIAMYQSLVRVTQDFRLYVLAMDDLCYNILSDLNYEKVTLISLDEFETMELKRAKANRSLGEYCWTCSSSLIYYVLMNYKEHVCTYIDSDLYFYSDPQVVIDEMLNEGKHVQIIEHGFDKNIIDQDFLKKCGRFCVEFNTFDDSEESISLLNWWKTSCLQCCSATRKNGVLGDQGYLDSWPENPAVSIVKNRGAGVAPWNIKQFKGVSENGYTLMHIRTKKKYSLVFFHFHGLIYYSQKEIKMNIFRYQYRMDYKLIKRIYEPYLYEINEIKEMLLEQYGFMPLLKEHPAYSTDTTLKKKTLLDKIRNITIQKIKYKLWHFFCYELPCSFHAKEDIIRLK